jgi:DivIVA domain-containing protein
MASDLHRLSAADASLSPELVAQRGFITARRGFDPDEVRKFLVQVAKELRAVKQREATLEEALREAEYRAAHPTWDQDSLLSAVGDETASILRSAHSAAADIRARAEEVLQAANAGATDIKAKAEENAAKILKEAREHADATRAEAEEVLAKRAGEAETVASRIREQANIDAERLRDSARQQAETVRAQAEAQRKAVVDAAQTTRERIMADLSRRRKVAAVQIEQLRAGRERLLDAYKVVRRTLDEVTDELQRADAEARAAADAAGRRAPEPVPPVEGELTDPTEAVVSDAGNGSILGSELVADPEEVSEEVVAPVASSSPSRAPGRGQREKPSDNGGGRVSVAEPAPPVNGLRPEPVQAPEPQGRIRPSRAEVSTTARSQAADTQLLPEAVPEDTAAVETLFARIRADRQQAVAKAREVLSDDDEEDVDEAASDGELEGSASDPITISDVDEAALQKRDEAVGTLEASLARRLKRVLQDEQNDLLDRLRSTRQPTPSLVLPDRDAAAERFAKAGRLLLDKAARAGAEFALSLLGLEQGVRKADLPKLDDLAADLAASIVDPLSRRLEQAFADGYDNDPVLLAESLGAAYREWKTQRIELTASDHVATAFARGSFAVTPEGTLQRWIVEDVEGPCPDCDDNALAGGLPRGKVFPTGQRHPPAHAGCRCLLVPDIT